ncbi:MAG: hypothetical protein OIN90_03930 [Candidatus Methanoperedens sp.]|nr:hypothetical protein [Candidatus Methanoperedens sp.]
MNYILLMRPLCSGTFKKSISVALSPARPDKIYAVRLLMVCFSAPPQKYIIPTRKWSSIPAGQTFKLGAPHLIKGRQATDFFLRERKGDDCFAHPL